MRSVFQIRGVSLDPELYFASYSMPLDELKSLIKFLKPTFLTGEQTLSLFKSDLEIGEESSTVGIYDGYYIKINPASPSIKVREGVYSLDVAGEKIIVPRKQ